MRVETIVDRIEGKKAVLITEEEEEIKIPAAWFSNIHEGMAIDITLTENEDREAASLEEAEDLLAQIRRENPAIVG